VIPTKAFSISTQIGILFALLITLSFAYVSPAQTRYCKCYTVSRTARRSHVRHVAYRPRVRRIYRPAPVVYEAVPATKVASYVGYAGRDDCADTYANSRVVVTDTVYGGRLYNTQRIACGWGHRDGFKDGWKAALKYRAYDPENNHDFRDGNNGYKRRFGSKFLYRTAYRDGYVSGYDSGFRSVAGDAAVVRY